MKKNQEELTILEKFVKLREKGPEEKLQHEIKKFQDAKEWFQAFILKKSDRGWSVKILVETKSKDQMISEMSKLSGEPEEKLRRELSKMASIWKKYTQTFVPKWIFISYSSTLN